MGRFKTEIDLIIHNTIRDSLKYAKLIGPSDDPEDFEEYSNHILVRYINEQLIYFPNMRRVLDSWILTAGNFLIVLTLMMKYQSIICLMSNKHHWMQVLKHQY